MGGGGSSTCLVKNKGEKGKIFGHAKRHI